MVIYNIPNISMKISLMLSGEMNPELEFSIMQLRDRSGHSITSVLLSQFSFQVKIFKFL